MAATMGGWVDGIITSSENIVLAGWVDGRVGGWVDGSVGGWVSGNFQGLFCLLRSS